MNRTVSDFHEIIGHMSLVMGCCLARHDMCLQGTLAMIITRADNRAKHARVHIPGKQWTMPRA